MKNWHNSLKRNNRYVTYIKTLIWLGLNNWCIMYKNLKKSYKPIEIKFTLVLSAYIVR